MNTLKALNRFACSILFCAFFVFKPLALASDDSVEAVSSGSWYSPYLRDVNEMTDKAYSWVMGFYSDLKRDTEHLVAEIKGDSSNESAAVAESADSNTEGSNLAMENRMKNLQQKSGIAGSAVTMEKLEKSGEVPSLDREVTTEGEKEE